MRQYELTVLFHPDLEMNMQPALDKLKKMVEDNGGKLTKEQNEGKKHLAYKIAKQDFAVYYYFELDLPSNNAAQKLALQLDIADEVLRHLLVTVDENRLKFEARRKAREANKAKEEGVEETTEEEK